MDLNRFPRRRYTEGPTPLHRLERLSESLGGPAIYIKRDDQLGLAGGGSKTRKLEYVASVKRKLAVERMRAEAMAMRSSDDLLKLLGMIWEEMANLGIDITGNTIRFVEEDEDGVHIRRRYYAFPNPRKFGISWRKRRIA